MKKKAAFILTAAVFAATLLPFTALAHGHSGSGSGYALCDTAQCTITETHKHDGIYYSGHSLNDGHSGHHSSQKGKDHY